MRRSPGVLPCECVRRGRAFRAGSCSREKASPSMASPAARPDRPHLTTAQGPRKSRRASCAPEAGATARLRVAVVSLPCMQGRVGVGCSCCCRCFCAQERAASPGAPMARRVGKGKSEGWPAGMRASFSPAQDVLSKNPVAHPRTRRAGCPEGAPSGCSSLWLLSLEHARESDSGRGSGSKPPCRSREASKRLPPPESRQSEVPGFPPSRE